MAEQKFTPRAENVLRLAQETALELGHGYVGCEHILLGLLREDGSAACRALGEAGVTEEQLREQLVRTVGHGLSGSLPSQGLTPRARSAVEMAVAEAMRFASPRIGTEHLLLGLLRDGGNMAVRLLAAVGADPKRLYAAVVRRINETPRTAAKEGSRMLRENESGKRGRGLAEFARDLTAMARMGQLDPVIGRDTEITRAVQILSRRTSSSSAFTRSSNSPRYFVPATIAERSSDSRRLSISSSGTSAAAIFCASPSATAVLPTPGSPMSTGLFFVRRERICTARAISVSRPITGSSCPMRAIAVRSRANSASPRPRLPLSFSRSIRFPSFAAVRGVSLIRRTTAA